MSVNIHLGYGGGGMAESEKALHWERLAEELNAIYPKCKKSPADWQTVSKKKVTT